MTELDIEARAFLKEFQDQPEDVRQVFIYAMCQTMQQSGQLEFLGAFDNPGIGVTLLYRNPDADEVFEIVKPDITQEEESALNEHIAELLEQNARSAV
jgi:hypothetical protein